MPHQCTNCNRTFADGSKEMLGGCPECGGNKFQFLPSGAVDDTAGAQVQATLEESATRGDRTACEDDIIEAPAEPITAATSDREDRAQASARRALVSEDELPPAEARNEPASNVPDDEERPDLAQLREELNEQFESIKILRPGEYELNLMELYDREEYIIALEEDGRYVIDVPDTWRDD